MTSTATIPPPVKSGKKIRIHLEDGKPVVVVVERGERADG